MELSSHNMMGMYHRVVVDDDDHHHHHHHKLMEMMHDHDDYEDHTYISESSSSSFEDHSSNSKESSSSDLLDDASSSSSPSPSLSSSPRASSNGPLFELSELMNQLPIKRGLSKYYQGKSQSFTSLAKVASLEDLAKKETAYQRRLKACKSYGGGLNSIRSPKAGISKKVSKGSLSNLSCLSRKGSFIGSCRPLNPVQSSF